jgi:hypothetical protein
MRLRVTEKNTVFEFDIVADREALMSKSNRNNASRRQWAPCVPGRLCEGF